MLIHFAAAAALRFQWRAVISLISIAGEGACVHVLSGKNSDSGVNIAEVHNAAAGVPSGASVCTDILFNVLAECRVTKSAGELDLMSYASWISSMAHVDVMREVHPGMLEYQLEARFLFHIAYHGDFHCGCCFRFVGVPLPVLELNLALRRLPPFCIHVHLRVRTQQRHLALWPCRRALPLAFLFVRCIPPPTKQHIRVSNLCAGAPNERVLSANDIALLDMGAECDSRATHMHCCNHM